MGLVYWSPCLGELKNQGLSTAQTTSTSFSADANGKIGKCIKVTSGIDTGLPGTQWDINQNSITMMGWFKFPEAEIRTVVNSYTDWDSIHQNMRCVLLGNNHYGGLSLHLVTNTIYGGSFSKINVMASIRSGSSLVGTVVEVPFDKWVHIAGVFDIDTKVEKIYINGTLQKTDSIANPLANDVPMRNFYICNDQINGGNGPAKYFPFYCNDIRVYTEALNDEKIAEISKGLTLHYSLSNRGFGGDNLLMNSRSIATTGSDGTNKPIKTFDTTTHIGRIEYVATTGLQNAYTWITGSLGGASAITELTTGQKTYTYAIDVRVTNYTSGDITAYIDFRNDSGTPNINVGRLLTEDEKDGNWHRITATATSNNQQDTRSLFGFTNSSTPSGSLTVIEYKNPKLEAGSIATPWVPHSTDTLYSSLQLGSTTEFDLSGYQYNAIKNSISNSSDSPINKGCYVFNGTSSWVKCDTNAWMIQGATEFTVNWWGYAEDWTAVTNGGRMVSCTETGGFNIEGGATGYLRFPRYVYTNADKTSRAYQYNNNGIKLADLTSGWHMFTLIYTLTGEQIYIDGELHSSANYTSYGISFNTGARLFIGCEANIGSPSSPYFNGKLADYRFYYTALDEDAIKELYMMGGET